MENSRSQPEASGTKLGLGSGWDILVILTQLIYDPVV